MLCLSVGILIILANLVQTKQHNILFVTPLPSPSHHIFNSALAFALAEKGYNITLLGPDQEKKTHKNFHQILLEDIYKNMHSSFEINSMIEMTPLETIFGFNEWGTVFCDLTLETQGLKKLMEYPKNFKFDLIIYDNSQSMCVYPIIDRFDKPPVIALVAFLIPHYLSNIFGNHVYPSYYPHYGLQVTNEMNFFQRLQSFLLTYGETIYRSRVFNKQQLERARSYFGDKVRPIEEYEREMVLMLSNTDPILDYPVSLPPNIIPIGGMHLRSPQKLPQDFEEILSNSKHGVILFSLGTNIQPQLLPKNMLEEFVEAFRLLKQNVIWKFQGEIPNLPKNIFLKKWVPQGDLLGHWNCKIFISHGGGLSTQEALYHGVPIIGIPGFGDQHKNVHKFVVKGLGLKLDFRNITRTAVYNAVQELLNNGSYKENIEVLSKIYKDQPQTSLERAVFWSEFVLRHKAEKIRSIFELPARDMYFFQTANLDVCGFLLVVLIVICFIFWKILSVLFFKTKSTVGGKFKTN